MRKILLTSNGFENKKISEMFLTLIGKEPEKIKVLFIPAAATTVEAIMVLPKCVNDLLDLGIPASNIAVYDLHCILPRGELHEYDAVYFTGGDPEYLLKRINEIHFDKLLRKFIDGGGVYVGVSAGSLVASNNMPDSLGYIDCTLSVHMTVGTKVARIHTPKCPHIDLAGNQAVLILDGKAEVIE